MPYQIPKSCIELFHQAGQLVIPIIDPADQSVSLDHRGKRPIKGVSFRRAKATQRYPYSDYHNAAWVIRHNVVIDIDPRNGGKESLAQLQEDIGIGLRQAAGGIGVKTGGGGAHFYFTLPEGFRVGPQIILHERYPGIDVKSGNGYVVIPGSLHYSGKPYEWLDSDVTIVGGLSMCPTGLLELIEKQEPEFGAITGGLDVASTASADQSRARVLVAEYEGAGSGERNESMYKLANRLLDFGLDSASAHEHLAAANVKNHPPMGQAEIHDIYKKAFSYRKNEFGALSVQSEFDQIDTSISMGGQRLSVEEARAQLTELTGRDEAIELAKTLREAHDDEQWAVVAELREKTLNAIAHSDPGAHAACKSILCGKGGMLSTAEYGKEIASRSATSSDDLPEAIGIMVLDRVYQGQRLRYSNDAFHCFNPNMWHHISDQEIQNHILDECQRLRADNPEFKVSHNAVMQAATNILRARTHIRPTNFFPHVDRVPPRVLNCGNGELWVDDEGGIEIRPADPSTRMFHTLNVDWNPDADCPTYKRVLKEVFQLCDEPKSVIRHHLEVKGYMLSPRKPLPVIEVCVGSGANGKSLLNASLVAAIAGGGSVGLGPLTMFKMDSPSSTARLKDRLVWIEPDLDHARPLPAGLLKAFSENTMLTVEPKYMPPVNIMSILSWTLLSNELPRSNDASRGLSRRIFCFPYDFDFESAGLADTGLLDKLLAEKEGIFRLWVEGLSRMLQRGGRFDVPGECEALKSLWLASQNILGSFISECCTMSAGSETYVRELYAQFRKYATRDGTPTDQVMPQQQFTRKLGSVGGLKVVAGNGNQRKVLGLRLDAWDDVSEVGGVGELAAPRELARAGSADWLQ